MTKAEMAQNKIDMERSGEEFRRKRACAETGEEYVPVYVKYSDGHFHNIAEAVKLKLIEPPEGYKTEEEVLKELEEKELRHEEAIKKLSEQKEEELYNFKNLGRLQSEAKTGGYGCLDCRYTGWVVAMGEVVKCKCQEAALINRANGKKTKKKETTIDVEAAISNGDKAAKLGIIPVARKDDEFDADFAKERIMRQAKAAKAIQVKGLDEYTTTLQKILAEISTNTLSCSYIIGAPKCCSKTTFVHTALKRLVNAGKKVMPYMSLGELAEIQIYYNKYASRAQKGKLSGKQNEAYTNDALGLDETPRYTWKDVKTVDVLFTYLTGFNMADLELSVLKDILQERGKLGLPTIVMTENSIAMYERSPDLKRVFWNDIMNYSQFEPTVKKLTHVATWRVFPNYSSK